MEVETREFLFLLSLSQLAELKEKYSIKTKLVRELSKNLNFLLLNTIDRYPLRVLFEEINVSSTK